MDRIQRDFMRSQLSVIFEQMRIIRELMGKVEMRLEEIEYEVEDPILVTDFPYDSRPEYCMCDDCWDIKPGLDTVDDDIDLMDCDCEFCRGEDRGHRMD